MNLGAWVLLLAGGSSLACSCAAEQGRDGSSDDAAVAGTGSGIAGALSSLNPPIQIVPEGAGGAPDCGRKTFMAQRRPAELLLVLDRSSSMKLVPDEQDASGSRKWDLVVPALKSVILDTDNTVHWGIKVFPEGSAAECASSGVTSHIDVPIAPLNASAVNTTIDAVTPEGQGTPTGDAVIAAAEYLRSLPETNPKYIVLATDGEPSCPSGNDGVDARKYAVDALAAAAAAGFHTFVVGVATTRATATGALNELAEAGREPRSASADSPLKYYLAVTREDLVQAMQLITGELPTCVFSLGEAPPVVENIGVRLDGELLDKDLTHQNGWDYTDESSTAVEMFGPPCDEVKRGGAEVEVVFACRGDVVR